MKIQTAPKLWINNNGVWEQIQVDDMSIIYLPNSSAPLFEEKDSLYINSDFDITIKTKRGLNDLLDSLKPKDKVKFKFFDGEVAYCTITCVILDKINCKKNKVWYTKLHFCPDREAYGLFEPLTSGGEPALYLKTIAKNNDEITITDQDGTETKFQTGSGSGTSSLEVLEITTSRTDNQYTIPIPNLSVDNYNFILDCYKNNKEVLIKWVCPDYTSNLPVYFKPNQVSTIGNHYFTTIRTTANGNHILKYQLVNGVVGYELIRIKEAITTESNYQYTQLHLEQTNQTKKIYKLNKDLEITTDYGTFKCCDLFEVSGLYFNFLSRYYHPKQSGNSLYNIFQEDQFNEKIGVINVADSDYQISGVLDLSLTYHDLFIETTTWDSDCICVIYEGEVVKAVSRADQAITGISNLYFKDKNAIQQLLLTTNYNFSTVNGQSLLTGSNISAGLNDIDYVSISNYFPIVLDPFTSFTPTSSNLVVWQNAINFNLTYENVSGVSSGSKTTGSEYELCYVSKSIISNNNIIYKIIDNENTRQYLNGYVMTNSNEVIPTLFRIKENGTEAVRENYMSIWINWNSNLNNKTIYKIVIPLNVYMTGE